MPSAISTIRYPKAVIFSIRLTCPTNDCQRRRRRGWLAWGMSSAAGALGYLPAGEPALLEVPTEAEIQELYTALELDTPDEPPRADDGDSSAGSTNGGGRIVCSLTVRFSWCEVRLPSRHLQPDSSCCAEQGRLCSVYRGSLHRKCKSGLAECLRLLLMLSDNTNSNDLWAGTALLCDCLCMLAVP